MESVKHMDDTMFGDALQDLLREFEYRLKGHTVDKRFKELSTVQILNNLNDLSKEYVNFLNTSK